MFPQLLEQLQLLRYPIQVQNKTASADEYNVRKLELLTTWSMQQKLNAQTHYKVSSFDIHQPIFVHVQFLSYEPNCLTNTRNWGFIGNLRYFYTEIV